MKVVTGGTTGDPFQDPSGCLKLQVVLNSVFSYTAEREFNLKIRHSKRRTAVSNNEYLEQYTVISYVHVRSLF